MREWEVDPEPIASAVIDAAIRIHRDLGPGLLESLYESILAGELDQQGFRVERRKPISFYYNGIRYADGFKVDLLVEGILVVELKAAEKIAPVFYRQLLTYLRALDLPIGLLLNFGGERLTDGLRRVCNDYRAPARER